MGVPLDVVDQDTVLLVCTADTAPDAYSQFRKCPVVAVMTSVVVELATYGRCVLICTAMKRPFAIQAVP